MTRHHCGAHASTEETVSSVFISVFIIVAMQGTAESASICRVGVCGDDERQTVGFSHPDRCPGWNWLVARLGYRPPQLSVHVHVTVRVEPFVRHPLRPDELVATGRGAG